MKKEYAVFGLGRFGRSVAMTLANAGCEVLAVDQNDVLVQEMAGHVTYAVRGDVTNAEMLNSLGISNYDGVIICMGGDLEATIMATILVKEIGIEYILAKARTELQGKVLKKVGVNEVVFPENDTGIRIANQLIYGNFFHTIELSDTYSILELDTPQVWSGHSIRELDIRAKYKVNVIGIKNKGEININPEPEKILNSEDVLIMIGRNETLKKISEM